MGSAMDEINTTLRFWFGEAAARGPVAPGQFDMWFTKSDEVDGIIRESFLDNILRAGRGELHGWRKTPDGALALILLCDQYTRNAFRGTALSFALDFMALRAARESIEQGFDVKVGPVQRSFFYLPLQHAEDLAVQHFSVERYEQLARELPGPLQKIGKSYLDYAIRHREIIERFGRFPHRNAMLGRASTVEEMEFLKQPGSGF